MEEKKKVSNWLEELKQNSWEPEILISGIAILGLVQVPGLLNDFLMYFKLNIFGRTSDIDNAVALLKVAVYWVIIGLVLHLVIRAIWVGMIGLAYSFSGGINHERLKLAAPFENKIKQIPSYQGIIYSLEKLASSVFSFSFLLFMIILGGYLYVFILLIIPLFTYFFLSGVEVGGDLPVWMLLYMSIMLVFGFIGLLDFLSLGFLKRFRVFAKIYWPVYRLINTFTLARLYRPIYYSYVSNYKSRNVILFLIFFVLSSLFWMNKLLDYQNTGDAYSRIQLWNNSSSYAINARSYEDQFGEEPSNIAQIQSDIIKGNTLRLFVVAGIDIERRILDYNTQETTLGMNQDSLNLAMVSSFYHIYMDSILLENLDWKFHYKVKTQQKGYQTYIDIEALPKGLHELKILAPPKRGRGFAIIPFYRE